MSGGDLLFIVEVLGRAWGSLLLRPYVFGFLAVYLLAATAAWGWRRAAAFTVWAGSLAFAAEWSRHVGIPFGLYHYTGVTAGRARPQAMRSAPPATTRPTYPTRSATPASTHC